MTHLPRVKSRHRILAVLFVTSIVSLVDRTAMTVALPFIKNEFMLSAVETGMVLSAFFAAYALAQIPGGLLADRFGVRKVATAALLWWSVFTAATGYVAGFTQMLVVRFLFGLGEGVYPACTFKTVAIWFPKLSRGTANAVMLSSSRLGQAISPLIVIWVITTLGGWRTVFFSLTIPGLLVAALFWFGVPNTPAEGRGVSKEELRELDEDTADEIRAGDVPTSFWDILRDTTILRYVLIYFVFDFAYWGFASWVPTWLIEARGFSAVQMGITASLPPLAGILGCIVGGWASDRFFGDNRRLPIIIFPILSALFLYLTFVSSSVGMVMLWQLLLGFFMNYFFASFWALPVSTVPKSRMGVVSGIINTAGQIAGTVSPVAVGVLITLSGGNFGATFAALIASLIIVSAIALTLPNTVRAGRKPSQD